MHSSPLQPAPNANAGFGKPIAVLLVLAAIGLVAAAGHALVSPDGVKRFMFAYLVGFACVMSLVVGNLFFVMVNHLSNAGWSVLIRRPMEAVLANVWLLAVLFLPIAFTVVQGNGLVYYWAQPVENIKTHHYDPYNVHGSHGDHGHDDHAKDSHDSHAKADGHAPAAEADAHAAVEAHGDHAADHPAVEGHHAGLDKIILGKRLYLNTPFFLLRWVIVFGVFGLMGWYYWSRSVRQDTTGDHTLTEKMNLVAGPGLLVFGLLTTFASFDLIMSLEAHWFSTMFGVYYFSGSVLFNFCFLILLLMWLQNSGRLTPSVNDEHYHDLGKFTFGFVFFWSYIAFSQYMLYWYANMPETTFWLHMRGVSTQAGGANSWTPVALVLLFGHFALPFAGLLSRHVKRNRKLLAGWAIWLFIMHWVDVVWMVMPSLSQGKHLDIGVMEIGLSVALLSIFLAAVLFTLGGQSLIPIKDPRLEESLSHQNM